MDMLLIIMDLRHNGEVREVLARWNCRGELISLGPSATRIATIPVSISGPSLPLFTHITTETQEDPKPRRRTPMRTQDHINYNHINFDTDIWIRPRY
jgi:hypothetical protein